MKEILDKYQLQIAALILIGFLAVVAFLIFGPKSSPPGLGRINRPNIAFGSQIPTRDIAINFVTERKFPNKAFVYKINRPKNSAEEAAALAKKFGFSGKPDSTEPFLWKSGQRQVSIQSDLSQINYQDLGVKPVAGGLDELGLKNTAKKFLADKGLSLASFVINEKARYFGTSAAHLEEVDNFEQASFVGINFDFKVDGLYVFSDSPFRLLATVILNKEGQIFKASYYQLRLGEKAEYPVKNREDTAGVLASQGRLIDIDPEGEKLIQSDLITRLIVEDAFLAYFLDNDSGYIQPIFIFRGRGLLEDYATDAVIYAPALEDRWLK